MCLRAWHKLYGSQNFSLGQNNFSGSKVLGYSPIGFSFLLIQGFSKVLGYSRIGFSFLLIQGFNLLRSDRNRNISSRQFLIPLDVVSFNNGFLFLPLVSRNFLRVVTFLHVSSFTQVDTVQHIRKFQNTFHRSSRPEVFLGKGILKICSNFTGEYTYRSAISIKLLWNFIEIAICHGCSPVNLFHIFRTPFPKNAPGRLLLS